MIYRVYSSYSHNPSTLSAIKSWQRNGIINVPVDDSELNRNLSGLPYLKDIIQKAVDQVNNDNDIIIYTNSDIGLVTDNIQFPTSQFFSVRKEVDKDKTYSTNEIKDISYENSVNCDLFGFTKKWYIENKHNIPDFIIGSPRWDLAFLILLKGVRLNNICYHVKHDSEWKKNFHHPKHSYNKFLFNQFQHKNGFNFDTHKQCTELYKYMSNNLGFGYLLRPKLITFYTPSHENLHELQISSLKKVYGDSVVIKSVKDSNQYCATASYHKEGWRQTQINKVSSLLNKVTYLKDGEIFIFCDADIIHLNSCIEEITELLEKYELVAQNSFSHSVNTYEPLCSGFFAAKKSKKSIFFLENILKALTNNPLDENFADQYYFNKFRIILKYFILGNDYFSPGAVFKGKVIKNLNEINDQILTIPETAKIVHSNWILGNENKYNYLLNIINNYGRNN